jgi:Domain of unknown function (DUF4913)
VADNDTQGLSWGKELVDVSAEPKLVYASVAEFVEKQLVPMYRRSLDGGQRAWCPEWWRHAEALVRMEALWLSWEHLRLDPALGMSVWLRDHLDHHMAVLLDAEGPFKRCSPDKGHRVLDLLPLEPPPAEFSDMTP